MSCFLLLLQLLVCLQLFGRGEGASSGVSQNVKSNAECVRALPASFSAAQRQILCSNPRLNQRGPANCAAFAKTYHYPLQETITLCANAPSDAPAQCMKLLSSSIRQKFGLLLCKDPQSLASSTPGSFPATCFNTLTTGPFKNALSVPPHEAAEFCRQVYDVAPLACALGAVKAGLTGLQGPAVLAACADSMVDEWTNRLTNTPDLGGAALHRLRQRPFWLQWLDRFGQKHSLEQLMEMKQAAVSLCLGDLKILISHSSSSSSSSSSFWGLTAYEAISFCSHANPVVAENDYFALLKRLSDEARAREEEERKQAKRRRKNNNNNQNNNIDNKKAGGKDTPLESPKRASILGECVHAAELVTSGGSAKGLMSVRQRLQLCQLSLSRHGPVNCARHIAVAGDADVKSNVSMIVALCNRAGVERDISTTAFHQIDGGVGRDSRQEELLRVLKLHEVEDGLATSRCYLESRGLGSAEQRIDLCAGAVSTAAAHCYRRAVASSRAFTHHDRLLLCISATSEDPAVCAHHAPSYLQPEEKIVLCMGSPNEKSSMPVTCLQHSEGKLRQFRPNDLSSKALEERQRRAQQLSRGSGFGGGSAASQKQALVLGDAVTRDLLLNMCSFGGSVEPLASAECLKRAPAELQVDDAVRACTNATSADVASRILLCHRLLPRGWTVADAASLCKAPTASQDEASSSSSSSSSSKVIKAVIQCAIDATTQLTRFAPLSDFDPTPTMGPWTKAEAAAVCSTEGAEGHVRACLQAAVPCASCAAAENHALINTDTLSSVCSSSAAGASPGLCLSLLLPLKLTFDSPSTIPLLCRQPRHDVVLACARAALAHHSLPITAQAVSRCAQEPRQLGSARLVSMETTGSGEPFVTAGKRFKLVFDLFDQYGLAMRAGGKGGDFVSVRLAVNENNVQGAVLWGARTNSTDSGRVAFSGLLVTLPGPLSFKLSSSSATSPSSGTLLAFSLTVREDEATKGAARCAVVFRHGQCQGSGGDADDLLPFVRSSLPFAPSYLSALACMPVYASWFVAAHIGPGFAIFEYRAAIDAIWTGRGLPSAEQTFHQRLGLVDPSLTGAVLTPRALKKKYYSASLMWHPDRWTGMPVYHDVVSEAFELVTEAYEGLQRQMEEGSPNDSASAVEAVYE